MKAKVWVPADDSRPVCIGLLPETPAEFAVVRDIQSLRRAGMILGKSGDPDFYAFQVEMTEHL